MPEDTNALRRLGRSTGLLYLVIIVCAGFSEGYVRTTLIVPADAAATAENILASEGLFRLGFAADLIAFLADAAVAILLYVLLRPASHTVALLAAAFRLVAHPAIAAVNLLNHFGALLILRGGEALAAFEPEQLEALALAMLDLHGYGYLIGGAFFGVHCALLGWLLYQSDRFPAWLGFLLGAAAVGYLVETFVHVLAPGWSAPASTLVVVTAGIGEVVLCFWMIAKGVRASPGLLNDP